MGFCVFFIRSLTLWLSQFPFPIDMHHNLRMCSWLLWQGHFGLTVTLTSEKSQRKDFQVHVYLAWVGNFG